MYRKHRAFLSGLTILSLAAGAPSNGWVQNRLAAGEPITLTLPGASSLLSITSMTWSPDSTKIAFYTSNLGKWQRRIFMINVDGTNLVQLINTDIHEIAGPLWSPTDIRYRNYVIKSSSAFHISWSPDGTRIAFFRSDIAGVPGNRPGLFGPHLSVMNVDGSNIVGLPNALSPMWTSGNEISWLPDGRIAYLGQARGRGRRSIGFYAGNVDGTNFVRLADLNHLPTAYDDGPTFLHSASLSPDGSRIAYGIKSCWGYEDGDQIFVMSLDGTNLVRICGGGRRFADSDHIAWSPDGTKIASHYQPDYHSNHSRIRIIPLTSATANPGSRSRGHGHPRW